MAEIHALANHLRTNHSLQLREVLAVSEDQVKVTVVKTDKGMTRRGRSLPVRRSKDKHVKMKF